MSATILALAMLLDAGLGDPKWLWSRLPHPAAMMGSVIGWMDRSFNSGQHRRLKGAAVIGALITISVLIGQIIQSLPGGMIVQVILAAILLAQRDLVAHVTAVATGLAQSLTAGRHAVAHIVSRDTDQMNQSDAVRAAIESAAENLSDGVIAPAFWFLTFGLPGLLVYKFVNTADSMIGHRTPRYSEFGWAAARLDDLLNWLPSRLTALLITIVHMPRNRWPLIRRDAPLHRSPNAGWPEAAMAVCLDLALAGPRSYDGHRTEFAFVNARGRHVLDATDIRTVVVALWKTWALALVLVAAMALV